MTVSTYQQWLADGGPARPAPVIAEFAALLRRYGYTVYTFGDQSHLTADPPEDHTPFSATPWPGPQPYPLVMAVDVMPGGPVDWHPLGRRIVHDRLNGVPGTGWIKYANWTDLDGMCWHSSWQPGFVQRPSTDGGHIHVSARTDYAQLTDLRGWDPVAALAYTPVSLPDPQEDPMISNWISVQKGSTGRAALVVEGLLLAAGLPFGC